MSGTVDCRLGRAFLQVSSVLSVLLLVAAVAEAQTGGVTRRGGTGGGSDRGRGGGAVQRDDTKWTDTGSGRVKVLKLEPVKEGDDTYFAEIKVKPDGKGAKILTLKIRKGEDLPIELGGVKLTEEQLLDLPWKGLACNAEWGYASRQRKSEEKENKKERPRELKMLTLETFEVQGTIESIEGETIVLKATPMGGKEWPDVEERRAAMPDNKKGTTTKKPPPIVARKLKLRLLGDVTKLVGGDEGTLELGDFEVGQEVEATIACSINTGLVAKLRAPDLEGTKEDQGVSPPPPDGGGGDGGGPPAGGDGGRRGTRRGGRSG